MHSGRPPSRSKSVKPRRHTRTSRGRDPSIEQLRSPRSALRYESFVSTSFAAFALALVVVPSGARAQQQCARRIDLAVGGRARILWGRPMSTSLLSRPGIVALDPLPSELRIVGSARGEVMLTLHQVGLACNRFHITVRKGAAGGDQMVPLVRRSPPIPPAPATGDRALTLRIGQSRSLEAGDVRSYSLSGDIRAVEVRVHGRLIWIAARAPGRATLTLHRRWGTHFVRIVADGEAPPPAPRRLGPIRPPVRVETTRTGFAPMPGAGRVAVVAIRRGRC